MHVFAAAAGELLPGLVDAEVAAQRVEHRQRQRADLQHQRRRPPAASAASAARPRGRSRRRRCRRSRRCAGRRVSGTTVMSKCRVRMAPSPGTVACAWRTPVRVSGTNSARTASRCSGSTSSCSGGRWRVLRVVATERHPAFVDEGDARRCASVRKISSCTLLIVTLSSRSRCATSACAGRAACASPRARAGCARRSASSRPRRSAAPAPSRRQLRMPCPPVVTHVRQRVLDQHHQRARCATRGTPPAARRRARRGRRSWRARAPGR